MKTFAGALGGSILGPRAEDFASGEPRNLRSEGTLPRIPGTLYVGRRCRLDGFPFEMSPGNPALATKRSKFNDSLLGITNNVVAVSKG